MTVIGTVELIAKIDTSQFREGKKQVDRGIDDIVTKSEDGSGRSSSSFLKIGAALGVVAGAAQALVGRGINAITNSLGSAIKRVDTLNNAGRTFQNMGFSAQQTQKEIDGVKKSILGLPTPLDSAIKLVSLLASSTNDLSKSRQIFKALNDGILGFGGTTEQVETAVFQLSQAFSNGRVYAEDWNSMINAGLGPSLNAIAKKMGITSGALKSGLSDGKISVTKFQDALIDLDTNGGAGLKSLDTIVRDSTSGIQTGMANAGTAITRGLASIIQTIGSKNIANGIAGIGKAFESTLYAAAGFIKFIEAHNKIFQVLSIVIGSLLVPALVSYTIATALAGVQSLVAGAQIATAWLLALGPISIIGIAATALAALIITNWSTIKVWLSDFWGWVTNSALSAWNGVKNIFSGASAFFRDMWANITQLFGNVGTKVGNAIGNSFKSVINSVLNGAVGIINGFIRAINGAIDVINKIPKVNISRLGELAVPKLATGGIISAPTLAMVGEGNEPEAVMPLSKLDDILQKERSQGTTAGKADMSPTVVKLGYSPALMRQVAIETIKLVNQVQRAKGLPEIQIG